MNNIFTQLLSLSRQGESQLRVTLIGSVLVSILQEVIFLC